MIVSKTAQSGLVRPALWLWFAVFSVGFAQSFASLPAQASERDITHAIMRQELRRNYKAVAGELSCAPAREEGAPCELQLRDRASGETYHLQGGDSSALTREFLTGKRTTASIEGEMRSDGKGMLVKISQ